MLGYGAIAVILSFVSGLVVPAGFAQATGARNLSQEAPYIEDVNGRDSEAIVSVELGDSDQEVDRVKVTARLVDDNGDPTGGEVASGVVDNPGEEDPILVTVTGLANDTKYAFTATQASGGVESDKSDPPYLEEPTAASPPLAPTLHSVFGRDGSIVATWNPAGDAGSPVTGYEVTVQPGDHKASTPGDVTTATVTGLDNGTAYMVSVAAKNKAGLGSVGVSDDKTIGASTDGTVTPQPPYAPGKPVDVSAGPPPPNTDGTNPDPKADQKTLKVTWDPPEDDGGSPITGYTVTVSVNGEPVATKEVDGKTTETYVGGLTPDTEYSVAVVAHNAQNPVSPTRDVPPRVAAANAAATSDAVSAAPDVTWNEQAVLLARDSVATITGVTPTTVTFTTPPEQVKKLTKDNFIVVGENNNEHTPARSLA